MPGRMSDNGSEAGETGTFQTHRDEGEFYVKNKHYEKAIGSFNKAIEMNSEDIGCLISRAKCWLQLGNAGNALIDAETALSKDKSVVRGLCIKAESLYQMGDFENALVFFHRGPDSVKLEATGDLSLFYKQEEPIVYTPEEKAKSKKSQQKGTYSKPGQKKETKKERECPKSTADPKTIKQLLGALYGDKEYLEMLLKDESLTSNQTPMGGEIKGHVCDALEFLNDRADFWRQQKPMYARKPQSRGKYEESLRKATKTLQYVENIPDDEIQNKQDVLANLHSQIGNAYLEMGNDLENAKSRALDNLGRVHARKGDYEKAVDKTWLYHEIGRCYLELGKYTDAREHGEKSLAAAKEAEDEGWQLHASVLIAQSEVKCGDLQAAAESFERSLDMAKKTNDSAAENAIKRALEEVNDKIVRGVKDGDEQEEDRASNKSREGRESRQSGKDSPKYDDDFEDDKAVKSRASIASGGQLRGSTTSPTKRSGRETREEMSARASREATASAKGERASARSRSREASQGRTSVRESRKGSEHKVVVEQDSDSTKQNEGDDKQDKQSTGGSDAGDQDKERKGSDSNRSTSIFNRNTPVNVSNIFIVFSISKV
ncbi:hypothetical protein KUTeg_002427 [Tegillarca granosa]|uniref:Outer dynein arm-docking complex subunit 4 n=1 Tax=Tegillarca granosa TaxID=220873 RepID=A0ABQ9FUE4_TEGGR|nr:hypothetical protein KUTeg_002427 [Tegillarca granosa]